MLFTHQKRRLTTVTTIAFISILLLTIYIYWLNSASSQLLYTVTTRVSLSDVLFSPTGQFLATADVSGDIQFWNMVDGSLIRTIHAHTSAAILAFNPTGTQIVSAGKDQSIRLWNVSTGELLHTLWNSPGPQNDTFYSLAFSPDGSRIFAGTDAGRVIVFNAQAGDLLLILQAYPENLSSSKFPVRYVSTTLDNTLLLTVGSEGVKLWHLPDRKLVRYFSTEAIPQLKEHPSWGIFDTNYTRILTFSAVGVKYMSPAYNVWSLKGNLLTPSPSGPPIVELFKNGANGYSFAVNGERKIVAWGGGLDYGDYGGAWFYSLQNDPRILVWHLDEAQPRHILLGHKDNIVALSFSPDSKLLASVSRDKTMRLWRLSE